MDEREFAAPFAALHRETSARYAVIARRFGLTSQQTQLLCILAGDQPSFGELAARLGCDKTNVTGMVDRLERKGLLARETDPRDRRVSRIRLTTKGWALGDKLRAEFDAAMAHRCAALSTKDRAELLRLLTALAASGS